MTPDEARRLYVQLIEIAKLNPPISICKGSIERHHIVPKCKSCGGSPTNPNNIVKLTPRQHFEAHMLLCEVYPIGSIQRRDMKLAVHRLVHGNENMKNIVSAEEYELTKILRAQAMHELMKGRKQRQEVIDARAKKHRGMKRSKETCKRISKAKKGKRQSDEQRRRTSEIAQRPETKAKRMNAIRHSVHKRDPNTGIILETFNNVTAASRSIGVNRATIRACCKHTIRFVCGYIWSYVSDVFDFEIHMKHTEPKATLPQQQQPKERKKEKVHLVVPITKEERSRRNRVAQLKCKGTPEARQRNREAQLRPDVNEKRTIKLKAYYTSEYKQHLQTISPCSKSVNCYTKDMQFIAQYISIADAQRKLNISGVGVVCRGKQPFAGGFIWRYAKDCDPITHLPINNS